MADKWLVEIIMERIKGGKPKDKDDTVESTQKHNAQRINQEKTRGGGEGSRSSIRTLRASGSAFGSSNEILRDPAKAGEETSNHNATGDCTKRNYPIPASLTAPQIWINSGSSVEE